MMQAPMQRAVVFRRALPPTSRPSMPRTVVVLAGGDGWAVSCAVRPMSLRSMDRPSLLRRFNPPMHRPVSVHAVATMIARRVVQNQIDESHKMIRAHITLSARAICVSTKSALHARKMRVVLHHDPSVLRARRGFRVVHRAVASPPCCALRDGGDVPRAIAA
jgi:hypothetical protein